MLPVLRRLSRPTVAYVHDLVMAALSFVLSLYLRLGHSLGTYEADFLIIGTASFAAVAGMVYLWMDLYRGVWRYASLNDLLAIARAVTLIILIFLPIMFLTTRLQDLPRSLVVINWFVLTILLAAPRILYRLLKDGRFELTYDPAQDQRIKVLLIGAGDGAEMFIQAMGRRTRSDYQAVAILDEAGRRIGRHIRGIPIMGGIDDLAAVVKRLQQRGIAPQRLVITKPDLSAEKLRRMVEEAGQLGLTVSRLPRLTEFRTAGDDVDVRPVALEDLLGRPQNVLNRGAMKALVAGKRVLVTGAGGTIGSELVRQLAEIGPSRLVLLDNSEFNLYSIEMELKERAGGFTVRAVLGDIRNRGQIEALIGEERPELVFHAAALKHVPMVEAHPLEGVLTNVIGTRNVAEACRSHGVMAMVLISTDKAVNPSSVMGATKRLAESYCQALDVSGSAHDGGTRFVTVRFGNVLGSTGSVVPLFQRQLAAGGPLTVTHPEIKRYFMTVREAVELVLQASALGVGGVEGAGPGESGGKIFVLDMGEPVRIVDLARQMIRLAGRRPDKDVHIVFTGLRPGEKLNEELFHAGEALQPTVIKGILLADPRTADYAFLARGIDELQAAANAGRIDTVLSLIARHVPEYRIDSSLLQSAAASRSPNTARP